MTDETDLKVTRQSLFFVCCLITKLFSFIQFKIRYFQKLLYNSGRISEITMINTKKKMIRFGYRTPLTGPWFSQCVSWLFWVKLTFASQGAVLGKKEVSRARSSWSSFLSLLFVCAVFVFYWLCMFITNFLLSLNFFLVYFTRSITKMITSNWTWQDTFDLTTTILLTDYWCTALYLPIPQAHIINIIPWLIRILIRKWR